MRRLADPLVWSAVALAALVVFMGDTAPIFARLFPGVTPPVYARDSFAALFLSHAALVGIAGAVSGVVGVALAILVTRPAGSALRPLTDWVTVIGQAIPPVAILAVAVPAIGFGAVPTIIALILYGLLPIVENAVAGIEGVPDAIPLSAAAIGLTPWQVLWRVELPLAVPAIVNGLRLSVIVNIGTAAIGATVGARTLGTPIITGLVVNKPSYILQGAVVLALFAIVADLGFSRLEAALGRRRV